MSILPHRRHEQSGLGADLGSLAPPGTPSSDFRRSARTPELTDDSPLGHRNNSPSSDSDSQELSRRPKPSSRRESGSPVANPEERRNSGNHGRSNADAGREDLGEGANRSLWDPLLILENSGSVARDHLASERTFLAYVRTSLGLASMGVGACYIPSTSLSRGF
jgi:Domain of unknown function (DUF202)